MKDFEGFLTFIVGILAAGLLFWGLVTAVKKSLSLSKPQQNIKSSRILQEQRQRAQDITERQKRLMEDQRQRLRDMQRR